MVSNKLCLFFYIAYTCVDTDCISLTVPSYTNVKAFWLNSQLEVVVTVNVICS